MKNFLKFASTTFIVLSMFVTNVFAGDESPPRVSAITPSCAAAGEEVSLAGHGFGAKNVMIDVGGEFVDVLKATGHSADFLVPPTILPGFTTVTAVNPGGQEGTIEFQVKGDEICGNDIDDDCDGAIDEVEECPLASIEIDTSPFDLTFIPGETGNISTTVSFTTTGSDPFTIAVTQQVIALSGSDGGINVSPNVVGGFVSSTDKATVDNQEISALSDGVYEITTTAEVIETGEIVSTVARITVNSFQETLKIGIPGSEPDGLAPNKSTTVIFTTQVQGANSIMSVDVELGGDLIATLNDQGINGDIAANDKTFSGTVDVDTAGLTLGDCISVTATAIQGSETATSDTYDLCVSSFPLALAPSDLTNTVNDPVSGEPAVADEVLIVVSPGTTETVIAQIANNIGGTIVGSLPGLNIYQIKLQIPATSSSQLGQIIIDLEAFNEVISAEANVIVEGTAVTPSDSQFSSQSGVKKIRADEAWTIARGSVTIAVIDTGADLDHPDLSSKIIKGKDFVDGDTNPEDSHGHGTHVAGIAAANTDNAVGVAGVSWNSKVLVVRVLGSSQSGTLSNFANGVKYAADKGARIINISLGSTAGKTIICNAVSYATSKGSLVIAGAGNKGNSTKFYPAACAGAVAVGNTTSLDVPASNSNFGSWVDLAAPGTSILSTVPKGGTCTFCNSTGYGRMSGTSMSTPMVSGAAAVVLSREPTLTNAQVITRLERTAVKLTPSAQLGAGRIDLFEAVFNGSFEEGNLALWTRLGTSSSKTSLGSIAPFDRERMGSVSTGPAGAQESGTLSQSFTIQPGVTSFPISFKYAFVTEEYPEFVGSRYDDSLRIVLITPAGNSITLAEESVNASSFTAIDGIDFPGGDTTVGWTGWKTASQTIPVTDGAGTYQIFLEDAGDAVYDTETLIDAIKFESTD